MIVENSEMMRKMIKKMLRMSGFKLDRVEEATNGSEALAMLQDRPIDVILCDINMPEMNGMELLRKIRGRLDSCAESKVIMISAVTDKDLIDTAIAAGADDYITKPFSPEVFRTRLRPFLKATAGVI